MAKMWKQSVQDVLEVLKIEQEKKPLRLAVELGYLFYVRLFVESQQKESLQAYFPFAGFPMDWISGSDQVDAGQRDWQLQYQIQYCASMVEHDHFMDGAKSMENSCWNLELCKLTDAVFEAGQEEEGMPTVFGEVLEEMVRQIYRLGNSGLFFLPDSISELMTDLAGILCREKSVSVWNPACRTGAILGSISRKYTNWTAIGTEEDREYCQLAQMLRFFYGLESLHIRRGNPLKERGERTYDVILSNPTVGELSASCQDDFEVATRKEQLQYLQLVMEKLEKKGLAVLLVNEGVLFQYDAEQKVRRRLIEDYTLQSVISLPTEAFLPYTGAKASLLVFSHREEAQKEEPLVWFTELEEPGYTLDRHQAKTETNQIPHLLQCFEKRDQLEKQWKEALKQNPGKNQWENPMPLVWDEKWGWFADCKTIRENDYNLTASRYQPWREDDETVEEESLSSLLGTLEAMEQETVREIKNLIEMAKKYE